MTSSRTEPEAPSSRCSNTRLRRDPLRRRLRRRHADHGQPVHEHQRRGSATTWRRLPDFPAEIRAPAGTRPGVSGFQLQLQLEGHPHAGRLRPDVLVAMNPAALIVNIKDLKPGGIVVANTGNFAKKDLEEGPLDFEPARGRHARGLPRHRDRHQQARRRGAEARLAALDLQGRAALQELLHPWADVLAVQPAARADARSGCARSSSQAPELAEANQRALKRAASTRATSTRCSRVATRSTAPARCCPQGHLPQHHGQRGGRDGAGRGRGAGRT